jgi:hypothetical protein
MPDALEQSVQIFPDSTGKNVRVLQVTEVVDGVEKTVQMQVVAIADEKGNIIKSFEDEEFQDQLLEELEKIRFLLGQIVGGGSNVT